MQYMHMQYVAVLVRSFVVLLLYRIVVLYVDGFAWLNYRLIKIGCLEHEVADRIIHCIDSTIEAV